MKEDPHGTLALRRTLERQNAEIAAKEKAEQEKREAERRKKERIRDEFRFWFPVIISIGSLLVAIMK